MTERSRRRRKPALDSRIAATGLAACATLGLVIGMTSGQAPTPAGPTPSSGSVSPTPDPAPAPTTAPAPVPPPTNSGGS
jgi:hypothetical protein